MSQFVLVHGAWAGGWCWRRVSALLDSAGHEAHAVTLTGVGERAHLLSPSISLRTHIDDVLGLIAAEELDDIVLVGHSYGGMVITGVADALLRRGQGECLRQLVYVDAVTPHPGESWSSQHAPQTVAARIEAARQRPDQAIPQPDAQVFGLDGPDRDWVNRRQTPQPLGVYQDPLHFDAEALAGLERLFIDCTDPALPTIDVMRQRVRTEAGWQVVELPTGHHPMVSAPRELVEILIGMESLETDESDAELEPS
jgi:pimeloyl-ACP methyl ester carboxylesterase